MENNELKERIRKNVKEKIAVSNIREEFDMKTTNKRKIIYGITSSAAVFILGFGIIIGTNTFNNNQGQNNTHYGISDLQDVKNNKESLKTELNIYRVASLTSSDMDVKYDNYNQKMPPEIWEKILEEFKVANEISYENFINKIPENFNYLNFYTISMRGYKDANLPNEYRKHDYVFEYGTENKGKIFIALCKDEKPLRDYEFEFRGEKSQIGNTELEISQYNNQYIATFEFNNVNYDIETTDITENELLELLQSILTENTNKNTPAEDKDVGVKEQTNENINTVYPEYYGGKYVDSNGNNVVWICEDNTTNRKEICKFLGITESKTTFKTAKYSYNYLAELQNKISQKMIDKEFTFVTTSAVMEDNNNIKVTVISNKESDLNKIKSLDMIGGAIEIQYNENGMSKTELLVEKQ